MSEHASPGEPVTLGLVERIIALRSLPGAAGLEPGVLASIGAAAEPRRFKAGSLISRRARPLSRAIVPVEGRIVVREPERVRTVEPPSVIGLTHVLARDSAGVDCEALTDCVVLQIEIDDLEDAFEDFPPLLLGVVREFAVRSLAAVDPLTAFENCGAPPIAPAPARPLDLVERIMLLHAITGFGGGTIDAIAELARAAREIRPHEGDVLWREGDEATFMLAVLCGSVAGKGARVASFLAPGCSLVGDLSCFAREARGFTAIAGPNLVALALDRDALLDVWEDHAPAALEFIASLAQRLLRVER
jgi:CRP-like cAMP-binding protein